MRDFADRVNAVSALHVFDMDGTLLRGTTASIQLSRRLQCLEPLTALEADFAGGQISAAEFAVEVRELWSELSPEMVAEVLYSAPWIDQIGDVCADIAEHRERSMLVTMSPDFFAEHLYGFGMDVVAASRFPRLPFAAPIDPAGILEPRDKVRLTERELASRGLSHRDCVAYGDSMSDVPLFTRLDNTVAVNADETVERIAAVAYRGDSLMDAYRLGRQLLGRRQSSGSLPRNRPRSV